MAEAGQNSRRASASCGSMPLIKIPENTVRTAIVPTDHKKGCSRQIRCSRMILSHAASKAQICVGLRLSIIVNLLNKAPHLQQDCQKSNTNNFDAKSSNQEAMSCRPPTYRVSCYRDKIELTLLDHLVTRKKIPLNKAIFNYASAKN